MLSLPPKPRTSKPMKPVDRREAAIRHYPFIKQVARRLTRRLPRHVALEDIVSEGVVGLMESVDRFDPRRSDSFDSYAEFRIKGAILDALRAADYLSRDQRACVTEIRKVRRLLIRRLGRDPEPQELADELGCDLERYYELINRVVQSRPVSLRDKALGDLVIRHPELNPLSDSRTCEQRTLLVGAIMGLPERLRRIVALHYFEDMSLKEIGQLLGVTESRVCQLHGQAMHLLRESLADVD